MTEVIGIRFKGNGKEYYFNPNGVKVEPGTQVIVETSRGMEIGECVTGNKMVDEMSLLSPLRPMQRIATEEDLRMQQVNKEKEQKAFAICEEKIAFHGLDMKLVDVEYSFEGNKILFFFTSDDRVDFRELVKDLASSLHARIELRQIGVRDEARMLGGLGVCGRPFCCSSCMGDFQPVSIKMAKVQGLSLNPTKISGTCGRLMCCLKYEQDAYEDAIKRCPKADSFVETPDGCGTISAVNLLKETVKVRLDATPESPKDYKACEINVIRSGKGKRPDDYVEPPAEELEKLRYIDPEEEAKKAAMSSWIPSELDAKLESVFASTASAEKKQQAVEEKETAHENRRERDRRHRNHGNANAVKKAEVHPVKPAKQEAKPAKPEIKQPDAEAAKPSEKKANDTGNRRNRPWRRHHRRNNNGKSGQGQQPKSE